MVIVPLHCQCNMDSAQSNTSQLHIFTSLSTIIIASTPALFLHQRFSLKKFCHHVARTNTT